MQFPDSQYPSVLRGYDKRQSERLLNAAPDLLAACKRLLYAGTDTYACYCYELPGETCDHCTAAAAIAKAEGQ